MDVIYTDVDRVDLGVLDNYEIDMDLAEEKDFSLKVSAEEVQLDIYSYFYIQDEECGGRVEKVETDSDAGSVTYSGANARGLLAAKVFIPANGTSEQLAGNFSDVVAELLEDYGLSDIFEFDENSADPEVNHTVTGYTDIYTVITDMLDEIDYILDLRWVADDDGCKVLLQAMQRSDFSDAIQYGVSGCTSFILTQDYSGINHIIAVATDDDGVQYAIHVFVDEGGTVRPYATTENPIEDADYVLDESEKQLDGIYEKTEYLECSNNPVTNYKLLTERPSDWSTNCDSYYTQDVEGDEDDEDTEITYNAVEWEESTEYTALTSKPSDWSTNYGDYFEFEDDSDEYTSVSGTEKTTYKRVYKKPSDWAKNYADYYYYYNDGVSVSYESVSGVTYYTYKKQTSRPSDWSSSYDSYYYRKKTVTYKKVGKKKKKKKKVVKYSWETVTEALKKKGWKKNKYYTRYSNTKAPTWSSSTAYYSATTTTSAPTWSSGKYYEETTVQNAPAWVENTYYEAVLDHYSALVESAVSEFENSANSQTATMTLDELDASIGDTVGGYDKMTGLTITEDVTNIIYKNQNGTITLDYTIGGTSGIDINQAAGTTTTTLYVRLL